MELTEGVTTAVKRVISAWQGFTYIISPPLVRVMGGGISKSGQEVLSSKSMFGTWTAARELSFLNWDIESLEYPGYLGEGLLERGQFIGDIASFGEKASGADKFYVLDLWNPFVVLVLE